MNFKQEITSKQQAKQMQQQGKKLMAQALVGVIALAASPAFAQISKVNTVMTNVQTTLVGVSVTMFTLSIIWAGFKMSFQQAKWSEISNIVIGGILVGGASGIAAWLLA